MNNQISNLENTVDSLQGTIDSVSNTINNTQNTNNKYTEITDDLDGIDVLYVTDAINSNNNTYTLKGVIYTQYTLSNSELQQIINKGTMQINGEIYTIKDSATSDYELYAKNAEFPLYKIKQSNSNSYYLEAQAQISDVWKLTNTYKEITISSDTKCNFDYEEKYNTIGDVFNGFKTTEGPTETTNPISDNTFSFKFENGKCIEVTNVLTSI